MNTKEKIKKILTRERPLIDVWYYLQGNYRYRLYYATNWLKYLMRKRIREQIDFRIKVMDSECFNAGQCKICECETTKLQMADKACEGNCYPYMIPASKWKRIKTIIYDYYKPKNNV